MVDIEKSEIEKLKEKLRESNEIKLFYYNSWLEIEKVIIELKDLITYAGLDESNPPLYNKILDIIYRDSEADNNEKLS